MTKKVDMIVDMQYGSTGKGLLAGYLAMKNEYDVVVNANMPNAGHTFIDAAGNKMIHKVLPNGIVSPNCEKILIGPGSVFSVERLISEIENAMKFGYMKNSIVLIHPNAVPLHTKHIRREKGWNEIGSTQQGSSAAMIDKIQRSTTIPVIARDFNSIVLSKIFVTSTTNYNEAIRSANWILAEGAQGFSLGINEKFYPYCTSRDCSPARFMSDMAIPLPYLKKVIGTARTYPIRVGGTSGGCYLDQEEVTWESLGLEPETTTVTNRTRRVFTFSKQQIREAMYMMAPDEVFLNFCNYLLRSNRKLNNIINFFDGKVTYMGWGPSVSEVECIE